MVELLITLGVLAVLAALATFSIRRHLALARSAEALQSLGGIARAVVSAYLRDHNKSELLAAGSLSSTTVAGGKQTGGGKQDKGAEVTHGVRVCGDSVLVPNSLEAVRNRKYQPDSTTGKDYMTGDTTNGWKCIGYQNSQPQHYQFRYQLGGPPISVDLPHGGTPQGIPANRKWTAYARGDVDGDGKLSWFTLQGYAKAQGDMTIATAVDIQQQDE